MSRNPASRLSPRWPRSAPAQKAGGAPVTTTAPTSSRASSSSKAATISCTIGIVSELRRSAAAGVRVATPRSVSTSTVMCSVTDDRGGVAEEVLDVALVAVPLLGADGPPEPARLGEALDGAGRRVAVVEAGRLQPAVVDAPPVPQ